MSDLQQVDCRARAQRHVEGGRRIIAAQEEIIAQMKATGRDLTEAISLLESFYHTQEIFEDELQRLSGEGSKVSTSASP